MIRDDQQINRRAPGIVSLGQQTRINMSMWADQRQGLDVLIQYARYLALSGIRREVAVGTSLWHRIKPFFVTFQKFNKWPAPPQGNYYTFCECYKEKNFQFFSL